jgi:hypothetical protein
MLGFMEGTPTVLLMTRCVNDWSCTIMPGRFPSMIVTVVILAEILGR